VDPRPILEFLEPAFAGLEGLAFVSRRSWRLFEQIGIQLPRLPADIRLVDRISTPSIIGGWFFDVPTARILSFCLRMVYIFEDNLRYIRKRSVILTPRCV